MSHYIKGPFNENGVITCAGTLLRCGICQVAVSREPESKSQTEIMTNDRVIFAQSQPTVK